MSDGMFSCSNRHCKAALYEKHRPNCPQLRTEYGQVTQEMAQQEYNRRAVKQLFRLFKKGR